MEIEISTPALLFPAISLLLLAYTNRFLTTGQLIRSISHQAREHGGQELAGQIENLKKRLELTKWMQFFGVVSILLCTMSMFSLFLEFHNFGKAIFGLSLVTMCLSLFISLWEVYISSNALNLELKDLYEKCK
ncbi:MAG: DUF2721 domain-containing protein [Arcobacter sp.]|jgi:hypothetical protein|uniref:DUF2721 domain-containing membrane protein n=1 Tax=Arcobacter defluvii TaxID=873191 RepID=A0AAE7BFT0_9BACT|nr:MULTISPECIES: DUF2721 domain-containing protein [Arcobacter]MDY3201308.1 DUF2721 domain-containing protein [Arcobacter sp.]QKF76994.1 DUF2721 domain-containing membrane protein [Arcobacter defluvii]RXI29831.1 DUF2721 domain-containing protein [Arcobacter defluvii]BAK72897.1 conserved hypothetical protein [Arcobacter sp. L]